MQHFPEDLKPGMPGFFTPFTPDRLQRAIWISLFTWHRDDETPEKLGFWGDTHGLNIGSRLWRLKQRKLDPSCLADAKLYCEEALDWLVRDGICRQVAVAAQRRGTEALDITCTFAMPDGRILSHSFGDIMRKLHA